jgi:hypothetical protein
MKLALVRNKEKYNGFTIRDLNNEHQFFYLDGNGNQSLPVILLSLDPHIVYGMSHPSTITRIFQDGPQTLLTTKKIAHTLYEHGLKACWGQVTLGNTPMYTQMNTFYAIQDEFEFSPYRDITLMAKVHSREEKPFLEITIRKGVDQAHSNKSFIISPSGIKPQVNNLVEKVINPDTIMDYVLLE